MEHQPCYSVGLGGDGDEVDAIQDVEREFGVALNYEDATRWLTAGDVYASLLKSLPAGATHDPAIWSRSAAALSRQTGIDPNLISKNSPLLLPQSAFWNREGVWAAVVLSLLALILVTFLLGSLADF